MTQTHTDVYLAVYATGTRRCNLTLGEIQGWRIAK